MHLLRFLIITGLVLSIISCKPRGPLTPEDAFDRVKIAYEKDDSEAIEFLLSDASRKKIQNMISMIKQMPSKRLKALSKRLKVTPEDLKNITVREYLALQFKMSKRIGEDTLKEITKYKIIGKDIKGNRAVLRVENGMELTFIKEGPYWRLDLEEL